MTVYDVLEKIDDINIIIDRAHDKFLSCPEFSKDYDFYNEVKTLLGEYKDMMLSLKIANK